LNSLSSSRTSTPLSVSWYQSQPILNFTSSDDGYSSNVFTYLN
jgi:hypothetical protein